MVCNRTFPRSVALAAIFCTVVGVSASGARAQVTDEEISAAIQKGVNFFFSRQTDKGQFSPTGSYGNTHGGFIGGHEVCAMLALAYADVSLNDEHMAKGFKALLEMPMFHTYTRSLRIMVIAKLLPKLKRDRELFERARQVMKADASFLIQTQHDNGGWGYPVYVGDSELSKAKKTLLDATEIKLAPNDTWWDFSNTQIAILGLSEAAHAGLEIPEAVFAKTQDLYLKEQFPDGGWDYGHEFGSKNEHRDNPYGSMSAAAVASLFLTRDILFPGAGCPCRSGHSSSRVPKLDEAIDRGLGWLGKYFKATEHPAVIAGGAEKLTNWLHYWLYSCERAGMASGMKYFGTHDWYGEGARYLVHKQGRDGGWGDSNTTAWAICFLAKGRAPLLFNKLQFDGEWNNHPRDLSNLVKYISTVLKEQPFRWQIINFIAPVAEWHDAPILYISAESDMKLTDEQKKKLREFTDTGGTILYEASCTNAAAKTSWEAAMAEIWPEFELKRLEKEHPLWGADQKITGRLPILSGMDDGLRTFLFVSWADLSCPWSVYSITRQPQLFQLGANLYVYATDRRPLRAALASRPSMTREAYIAARLSAGSRAGLKLARLSHGGDWYLGRNCKLLDRLAKSAAEVSGLRPTVAEPVAPADLAASGVNVLWIMGRKSLRLSEDERTAITDWLAKGGTFVAEAAMGGTAFDENFRAVASEMGLRMLPLGRDAPILRGSLSGAAGYSIDTVRFKFALKEARIGKPNPDLFGVYLGDKMVGVYSPFDLTYCQTGMDAFDCRGYETEDARAILVNILLWASTR